MSFDFAAFAVTKVQAGPRFKIADCTVEEARDHVVVRDGNIKKPVEGFQGLTLKLGRVKLSLDAVAPKAIKLQVPNDQVEAVTEALLAQVKEGTFDAAIEAGLLALNTVHVPKSAAAPTEEGLEEFEEDDLSA